MQNIHMGNSINTIDCIKNKLVNKAICLAHACQ